MTLPNRKPADWADADYDSLRARYRAVRDQSEALCADLTSEDCAVQSMSYASPAKWHLAHTTWFFETFVLEGRVPGYQPFRPAYRVLFNSYYNTVGDQHPRPQRGLLTRPSLSEVRAYRARVDEDMEALFDAAAAADAVDLIELGLHHEQQHQELILMDIKHLFSSNPLAPAYREPGPCDPQARTAQTGWIEYPEGLRRIGHTGPGFAFDNEGPCHSVYLRAFALADRTVTNGEYRAFIEDDGYRRPDLWLSDGWDAVRGQDWAAPLYWQRRDRDWAQFTLNGMGSVRDADPVVHVSYFEADAYARWLGARLPTEAEWEIAAAQATPAGNFIEDGWLAPRPCPPAAGASEGPRGMFGDVWEWTASPYMPYPGYAPPAGALGEYNGKFMCNQIVLRGGACVTPRSHIRATYRNFFQPELRWQFGGFRLARDLG